MTKQDLAEAELKLEHYKQKWQLVPDGKAFSTDWSLLQPVLHKNEPAILKIAMEQEERLGGVLMTWWNGEGAAKVLNYDTEALLLERAVGKASLMDIVKDGQDDEASRIICAVIAKLHEPRPQPLPELIPLTTWFKELAPAAKLQRGVFVDSLRYADELLKDQHDIVPLHGDIHYENILDSGRRGWIAIDPKRLIGERTFDYTNLFCNPDITIAGAPGRLSRQLQIVAQEANLDPKRLLKWIIAWAGLSASWFLNDGEDALADVEAELLVAKIALAELEKF
ncbi:MAG: 3-kinase [Mucilaginibacter sp.]|nr:3-kinase [Mucilaginibacter sp.]